MQIELLLNNLLSPPILFFGLGILAVLLRSDLKIPEPLPKLFSLYLLWAIGFKGGVKLAGAGFSVGSILPLVAAVMLSAVLPLLNYPILRLKLAKADACACAAAFGSVSVVTFITAANFLESINLPYAGHLVAALALMESPAIVVAVMLYRTQRRTPNPTDEPSPPSIGALLHEAFFSGPVFLLLGSLLVGALSGQRGYEKLQPFTDDIFHGMLVLFLLNAGMDASKRMKDLANIRSFAIVIGIAVPLINAAIGLAVARLLGLPEGDAFLFTMLSASASYIAVPAAMSMAIPKASAGIYLPIALGITFPFNIALGIPLYLSAVRLFWPDS